MEKTVEIQRRLWVIRHFWRITCTTLSAKWIISVFHGWWEAIFKQLVCKHYQLPIC